LGCFPHSGTEPKHAQVGDRQGLTQLGIQGQGRAQPHLTEAPPLPFPPFYSFPRPTHDHPITRSTFPSHPVDASLSPPVFPIPLPLSFFPTLFICLPFLGDTILDQCSDVASLFLCHHHHTPVLGPFIRIYLSSVIKPKKAPSTLRSAALPASALDTTDQHPLSKRTFRVSLLPRLNIVPRSFHVTRGWEKSLCFGNTPSHNPTLHRLQFCLTATSTPFVSQLQQAPSLSS